jgi:ferredoxin-nitrite reductase
VVGFNLLVGGALGGKDPTLAESLGAFVPPEQVVPAALAVLESFRDHGSREKRKQARLKWLIRDWGVERFRADVERRLDSPLASAGKPTTDLQAGDHLGVRSQRQPGLNTVGLHIPVGRVTAEQLVELGRLASIYGQGELRLTVQQNVLIPHVADSQIRALLAEPLLRDLSEDPSPFLRSVVACTGTDYCHFSLIDTKGEALNLGRALDDRYELDRPLRIQVSGCPNACGQHRIGEIGLLGVRTRVDGEIRDAADIFADGRLGDDPRLASEVESGVLVEELPERVARQITALQAPGALRPRQIADVAAGGGA